MISLSKNTVSATAAANTIIGTLTLLDSTGTAYNANWSLTPNAANYFNAGAEYSRRFARRSPLASTPSRFALTPPPLI